MHVENKRKQRQRIQAGLDILTEVAKGDGPASANKDTLYAFFSKEDDSDYKSHGDED